MSEYVRQELLDEWIVAHDKQKARAEAAEKREQDLIEDLRVALVERDAAERKMARLEALAREWEGELWHQGLLEEGRAEFWAGRVRAALEETDG